MQQDDDSDLVVQGKIPQEKLDHERLVFGNITRNSLYKRREDTYPWGRPKRMRVPWGRGYFREIHNHTWSHWLWDFYDLPNAMIRQLSDFWQCNDTLSKNNTIIGQPERRKFDVWSKGFKESDDRIVKQLSLLASDVIPYKPGLLSNQTALKKIVVFANPILLPRLATLGQEVFIKDNCPINTCTIHSADDERTLAHKADALLFIYEPKSLRSVLQNLKFF